MMRSVTRWVNVLVAAFCCCYGGGGGCTADGAPDYYKAWHGRTVYFVVTDRFSVGRNDKDTDTADRATCAGRDWCGGNLRGVLERLDYIQAMGFDAVWITPVVKQVPWKDRWNGTGYHGYWAQDFHRIEPRLGTSDDLHALSAALHSRGMLLMLDVVANHVGPLHTPSQVNRLGPGINHMTALHQLGRAPNESVQAYLDNPVTMMEAGDACWPNYSLGGHCNYTILLDGWFGDLGDLRQEDTPTRVYLKSWISYMVQHYKLDGLRLDTALYMPKQFLAEFQVSAGVYIVGEVVMENITLHRSFVPSLSSLLNFPVTGSLKRVFSARGDLRDLSRLLLEQQAAQYPMQGALLANFVDNHDSSRFLFNHSDEGAVTSLMQLRNALAFVMLWQGVPVIYYGTENVAVSNVSDTRTSMWQTGFGETALTRYVKELHRLRKDHGMAHGGPHAVSAATISSVDARTLTFQRGGLTVTVNNMGEPPVFKTFASE